MSIKCACGNEGCKVELRVEKGNLSDTYILITWEEKDVSKSIVVCLDANGLVDLIKELKNSLVNLA